MKNLIIITILALFSFQIQAQSKKQLKKQMNQEIEKIRTTKSAGIFFAFNDYFTAMPDELLQEIAVYETDSLAEIRKFAIDLLNQVGQKNSDSLIRKTVVTKLSKACSDDDFAVRSIAAVYLKRYAKNNFSEDAKKQFSELLERDYTYYQHVLQLVGYIDMTEEIPELKAILSDTTHNDQRIIWKVHTALARLGSEESIDYCVDYAKSKDMNNLLVKIVLSDLAYIKQPETTGYLVSELYKDEKNCKAANPNSSGKITCAYRIMELLAPIIEDFPYKAKYGTQLDVPSYKKALTDIREWFKEHPDYKIKQDFY